ncbi:MAG: hypothetical protein IJA08_04925 [Clostridia bacterium]|nr:hypothetical protein [Clostridia bacterium]
MKNKHLLSTTIFALVLASLTFGCWFGPRAAYSESERRPLAEEPMLTIESVLSGEFQEAFELFSVDHFPFRDHFRSIKAMFSGYALGKKDNNGLFTVEGHISKLEYPENPEMKEHAANRFRYLYETYLKDTNAKIYLSVVPDKNYFLAEKNGYLSLNYPAFIEDFKTRMEYAEYIDILPLLSLDDFYRTDSHWKQEEITDIAEFIGNAMGTDVKSEYTVNTLDVPFSGVYLGQSALPFAPDTIRYLTNETLSACKVNYFDSGKAEPGEIYNMEKAHGKDPYEMFLSGTSALIEIENPNSKTDKELVVFRDSYGSSLVPLLAAGYQKITVVDIRYLQSSFLGNFISFDNQDVLFMYSTTLLNNSMSLR